MNTLLKPRNRVAPLQWSKMTLLVGTAALATACAQPSLGGGGVSFIGGAAGTPCDPTAVFQGCSLGQRVECNPASSSWSVIDACAAGQYCVEKVEPGNPKPLYRTASCQGGAANGASDAGTADATSGETMTNDAPAGDSPVGSDASTGDGKISVDAPPGDSPVGFDASTGDGEVGTDGSITTSDILSGPGYNFVTIDGAPELDPDCKTSSVGADIDVIAIYTAQGALKGVAKTVVHKDGASPICPTWGSFNQCSYGILKPACHNDPNDVTGGLTTKMYADATPDTGYFGLGGGTVEVTIGACSISTTDVKLCDGKGPTVQIVPGDEVDLYEVDGSYKKVGSGPASGIAPDACICKADMYEVFVSKKPGEGLFSLGKFAGSKGMIKVQ